MIIHLVAPRVTATDRIDACVPLVDQAQVRCWALLDKYLMERIVPVVPFLTYTSVRTTSVRVRNFTFDGFVAGEPALDHLAVAGPPLT